MKFQICKINGKYAIREKYLFGTGSFIGRYCGDGITDWYIKESVIKFCLYNTEAEVIEVGKQWKAEKQPTFKLEVVRVINL